MKQILVLIAGWLILAGTASAHSFNVTMIIPAGAAEAALRAFLVASSERDNHPDETSDGHLGGVDSHVQFVGFDGDGQASLANVIRTEPDIVVILITALSLAKFTIPGVLVFQVTDISSPAKQAFLADTAALPSDTGRRVYVAARLIDIAVRQQDGAEDIAALARAIENY